LAIEPVHADAAVRSPETGTARAFTRLCNALLGYAFSASAELGVTMRKAGFLCTKTEVVFTGSRQVHLILATEHVGEILLCAERLSDGSRVYVRRVYRMPPRVDVRAPQFNEGRWHR
jgi:hypothetical protein